MSRNLQIEINIAKEYRDKTGRLNGVVVLFDESVAGWMDELRNPEHWMPSSIAIDVAENQYVAVGGSNHDGAGSWEKVI